MIDYPTSHHAHWHDMLEGHCLTVNKQDGSCVSLRIHYSTQ